MQQEKHEMEGISLIGKIVFFSLYNYIDSKQKMLEGLQDIISDRPIQPQTDAQLQQKMSNTEKTTKQKTKSIFMDIRINADDQSSCKIAAYWIILISVIIAVSLLSGLALPSSILPKDKKESLTGSNIEGCTNSLLLSGLQLVCGTQPLSRTLGQFVSGVEPLNQFLVFYIDFDSDSTNNSISVSETINFKLYTVNRRQLQNGSIILQTSEMVKEEQVQIRSNHFRQTQFYINYVNELEEGEQYYWEIEFDQKFKGFSSPMSLESYVINPKYSLFCIILRGVFLLISVLFLFISSIKFFKINPDRVLPEQKVILFLSALTITFNDPLYIGTILSPGTLTSFLSTFFTWNFLTTLIVIWVFFLQRIKDEQGELQTQLKTCPNITLIILFYLSNMIFRVGLALEQTHNRPFTDPNLISNSVVSTSFVISTLAFMVTLVYIFHLYCSLWGRAQLMWRNTLFISLSFFFCVIVFYLFLIGGFNVFEYSAKTVMFTYTFINIYSYYLQYLYMPSNTSNEKEQFEKQIEKSVGEFDLTDISIELENQGYDVFMEYGASKLSDDQEFTIGKSYLGQNIKNQGSKIVSLKQSEEKSIPEKIEQRIEEEKVNQQSADEKQEEEKVQNEEDQVVAESEPEKIQQEKQKSESAV